MRRLLLILFSLSLLGAVSAAAPIVKPAQTEFSGKCVDVYSGDTIGVLVGEDKLIVRLYGIDAAEEGRPYAQQSLDFLKKRVLNKAVKVYRAGANEGEFDVSGWVFLGQECMNVASLEGGYSWWDLNNAPSEKKLEDCEQRAREGKKGLWAAAYPTPPWEMDSFWADHSGIQELLVKHIKDIPLLEAKTDSEGRPLFSQVTLKLFPTSTPNEWAGGFRFKVPREARTFVWAFLPPPQFTRWSICARSGGVAGFRNYMHRARNHFPALKNLEPRAANELFLQTLNAYSLLPGQEYILHFWFDKSTPATFQVMHTFSDTLDARTRTTRDVVDVLGLEFNEHLDALGIHRVTRDLGLEPNENRVVVSDAEPLMQLNSYVHAWHLSPSPTEWPERGRFLAISPTRRQQLTSDLKQRPLQYFFTPFIDFAASYPNAPHNNSLAFAYRTLRSDKARKVTLLTGSDDTMRVWVNGELVVNKPELRAAQPDSDHTAANLVAGDNEVLVEISSGDGGWGFFFRLLDETGQELIAAPDGSLRPRKYFYDAQRFVRSWRFSATPNQWISKQYFNTVTPEQVSTITSELKKLPPVTSSVPFIDMRTRYSPMGLTDHKTAFALATVNSSKAQPAVLLTGSDDALRVWLNGELVVKKLVLRAAQADDDQTPVMLRQGANSILVEVSSGDGGWGFFLALNDSEGNNLLVRPDGALSPRTPS